MIRVWNSQPGRNCKSMWWIHNSIRNISKLPTSFGHYTVISVRASITIESCRQLMWISQNCKSITCSCNSYQKNPNHKAEPSIENLALNRYKYLITEGINESSKHRIIDLSILFFVHFGHNAVNMVQNVIDHDKQTRGDIPSIPAIWILTSRACWLGWCCFKK